MSGAVRQPPGMSARALARHGLRGYFSLAFGEGLAQDGCAIGQKRRKPSSWLRRAFIFRRGSTTTTERDFYV
jgi:hypothetical protein